MNCKKNQTIVELIFLNQILLQKVVELQFVLTFFHDKTTTSREKTRVEMKRKKGNQRDAMDSQFEADVKNAFIYHKN